MTIIELGGGIDMKRRICLVQVGSFSGGFGILENYPKYLHRAYAEIIPAFMEKLCLFLGEQLVELHEEPEFIVAVSLYYPFWMIESSDSDRLLMVKNIARDRGIKYVHMTPFPQKCRDVDLIFAYHFPRVVAQDEDHERFSEEVALAIFKKIEEVS